MRGLAYPYELKDISVIARVFEVVLVLEKSVLGRIDQWETEVLEAAPASTPSVSTAATAGATQETAAGSVVSINAHARVDVSTSCADSLSKDVSNSFTVNHDPTSTDNDTKRTRANTNDESKSKIAPLNIARPAQARAELRRELQACREYITKDCTARLGELVTIAMQISSTGAMALWSRWLKRDPTASLQSLLLF